MLASVCTPISSKAGVPLIDLILSRERTCPFPMQAVCRVYSAALAAVTEGIPWIRAVDVWHVSSIPEHEAVFFPESPPVLDKSGSCLGEDKTSARNPSIPATSGDGKHVDRFDERIVGHTWAGSPAVVLRSLRAPEKDESARIARWEQATEDDGLCCGDDSWTDQRLRLLAGEWKICTGKVATPSCASASKRDMNLAGQSRGGAVREDAGAAPESPATLTFARPFMVHSGHVIVPFTNRCAREDRDVVGHGLALAVDPGMDWSPWEPFLADVAAAATQRFEALEVEALAAEKLRAKAWAAKVLHSEQHHRATGDHENIDDGANDEAVGQTAGHQVDGFK